MSFFFLSLGLTLCSDKCLLQPHNIVLRSVQMWPIKWYRIKGDNVTRTNTSNTTSRIKAQMVHWFQLVSQSVNQSRL